MRDETIQTAEASSGAERDDRGKSKVLTWEEYQPSISQKQRSFGVGKEHVPATKTINSQIGNKSIISNPQITRGGNIANLDADEQLPLIIQGGKRITLANERLAKSSGPALGVRSFTESDKSRIEEPLPTASHKTARNKLASTNNSLALTNPKHAKELHPNTSSKITALSQTKIPSATLAASAPKNPHGEIETSRLANRIQEFAPALFPSFIAKAKPVEPYVDDKETENWEKTKKTRQHPDLASAASIIPDDGLLTNKDDLKNGITLPVVTEAARVKKMLLAFRKEIDYIRSTIKGLGILEDELPAPRSLKKQGTDRKSVV